MGQVSSWALNSIEFAKMLLIQQLIVLLALSTATFAAPTWKESNEGFRYEQLFRNKCRVLSPQQTYGLLELAKDELQQHRPDQREKIRIVDELMQASQVSVADCNLTAIKKLMDLLDDSTFADFVRDYLWFYRTRLFNTCRADGRKIDGFVELDEDIEQQVAKLSSFLIKTLSYDDFELSIRGVIWLVQTKSGDKKLLKRKTPRDEIKKLFKSFVIPFCAKVGSFKTMTQYLYQIDQFEDLDRLSNTWKKSQRFCYITLEDSTDVLDGIEDRLAGRKNVIRPGLVIKSYERAQAKSL